MDEAKAQEILLELIKKPGADAESIPKVWSEIMAVHKATFAPPIEPPKKKRRKGPKPTGWPRGVSKKLWQEWKQKNPEGTMAEFLKWHNEAHSHMPERLHGNDLGHGPDGYQEEHNALLDLPPMDEETRRAGPPVPDNIITLTATVPPYPRPDPDTRFPLDL